MKSKIFSIVVLVGQALLIILNYFKYLELKSTFSDFIFLFPALLTLAVVYIFEDAILHMSDIIILYKIIIYALICQIIISSLGGGSWWWILSVFISIYIGLIKYLIPVSKD